MSDPETITAPEAAARNVSPGFNQSTERWWLLSLLFAGMFFGYAQRGAFSVAAPFISQNLVLSKASIGVLLSAFFWSYSLMQIPAGWVVDRFGVRRAYSIGFIFWSLATACAWDSPPASRRSSDCAWRSAPGKPSHFPPHRAQSPIGFRSASAAP
ncbi:MAG: MFS transporter [Pyrinomonadaceae bacterium]